MDGIISHDRIIEIVGEIDDVRAAKIVATGASEDEIEEAAHWASGMSHLGKTVERPLRGVVAAVYDIPTSQRVFMEDDHEDGGAETA